MRGKPVTFWRTQIDAALSERRAREPWWEANLRAYAPRVTESPETYGTTVNTNRDFTLVERKKADLFYQRPEVTAQPTPLMEAPIAGPMGPLSVPDPQTGQPGPPILGTFAVQAHEEIVNELLGPDGIDASRLVHQTLFDVLSTQGVGFTKMGYESVTVPTPTPDPKWTPPIDPLTGLADPLAKPPIISVPVPIYETCFWQHFSGKKALIPHDFRSTEWDHAPWLGYQFELPLTPGNREKYHLPAEFKGATAGEKQYFEHGTDTTPKAEVFTGVELWYRSSLYREDVRHPEHLTHLVLVDGLEVPAIDEDSPDQTLDATGGLTPDSLIGFPIHPLNMRTLPDSAYPPSDCTVIRPLVNELNRFREQMVEYRDAQVLRWTYNTDTLPPDALSKIVRSPIGGMIGIPGDAFAGDGPFKELPHGSMPRESFTSNDYIDADIARTTAIDASGSGVQSTVNQTATEASIQQGNANARLDFERGVVLQWYLKGVTKFATLVQRYIPVKQATDIVGPERAQVWDVWRRQVPSRLAFTAMPDSALRVDQAIDRKQAQDLYSFLANDPYIQKGRAKLLEKLLRKYHIDPTGIVSPPDPPKPEPPKLALSFKGEDLVGPQAPIVIEILKQQGIEVSAGAVSLSQGMLLQQEQMQAAAAAEAAAQAGDTKHGGKLAQQESLSKHQSDLTGGMQNTGAPSPMGAGGIQ